MKVSEAITRADALRPNALEEEQKAVWLYDLDGQIAEMMCVPPQENMWPEKDGALLCALGGSVK